LIPYIIKQARPNDDDRYNNIIINLKSIKSIDDLDKVIINFIVDEMYEFCSKEYGHNIQITSYSDFCEKYWNILECKPYYWDSVFEVDYFDNKWIKWDIKNNEDKIFSTYMKKVS
jgi:hypothetical protein